MSPSRFLLAISPLVLSAATGCGDDDCGTGGAPASGLVVTAGADAITYGALTGGPNGDCPAADAPAGLSSLTIVATQDGGTGFVTLCVPRPDKLDDTAQLSLERAGGTAFVIDVRGSAAGCQLSLERTQAVTGTLHGEGACGNGLDPAGFALVVDAQLTISKQCGDVEQSVAATLRGRVAVQPTE